MSRPDTMLEAASVEAGAAASIPAASPATAIPGLGGNEIIELSIKPSRWSIVLNSLRMVAAMVLLTTSLTLAVAGKWTPLTAGGALLLIGAAVAQVALATLQWASRLYVLTNRRALRFSGIVAVRVDECALVRLAQPVLTADWTQRALHLGTIDLTPIGATTPSIQWEHLAHPQEVERAISRAIRRAHSGEG
ncbi:MAG: hypothetical protein U1D55_08835 [Phycisphaerae bacterium]